MSERSLAAEPRPAATVMLVRPHGGDFEVYMVRRSAQSAAFPAVYVFPGGRVDSDDAELARSAMLRHEMPAIPGRDASEPAYEAAALREAFEEAGILLAAKPDGSPLDAHPKLQAARTDALAGRRTFADILRELGAVLDARRLWYFSRWITPRARPRRYDTHFFLAEAPEGQHGSTDEFETDDGVWIAPREALRKHAAGEFPLVFPTMKHLERIAPYACIEELRAFATTKPIRTVRPDDERSPELPPGWENTW